MQGQALEVSISRIYLLLLGEFGGKGDRDLTTADGSRQKAVSRNRESKLIADCQILGVG
jgi:hypothetical protein